MAKTKSQLQKENRDLRAKVKLLEEDVEHFRSHLKADLKAQIEHISNKTYSSPDYLVKKIVATLNRVRPFYIWW